MKLKADSLNGNLWDVDSKEFKQSPLMKKIKECRKIKKIPMKILEAPLLEDNFYSSLLDWSK